MSVTFPSQIISVSINRSPQEVYDFASDPANLSHWASGIGASIKKVNDDWIAETPQGVVKVRFVERNAFGVLDHRVILASGAEIYAPMRVVPNGAGSELIFTLFRLPEMTDQKFAEDAAWVLKDLTALKNLLEAQK